MPTLRDDVNNVDMLNAIRSDARRDYQEMVPEATKANISETIAGIMSDNITRNEFMGALVNRIGSTIIRDISWRNPLAIFKQGMMPFGDTIEEVHTDLIKPTVYDENRDYLEKDVFGQARVPAYSAFHTRNYQQKVKVTVNQAVLRRAFLSDSGLSEMVSQIMATAATSDEWTEFLSMASLIRTYDEKHGLFRVKIPDLNVLTSNKNDTDAALKALRIYADKMQYPTPAYNAASVHSFGRPEDLVLIATPEFKANVDVTSLSAAFNRADAEAPSHIITIPNESLGLTDVSAILTTKDFFLIKDVLIENRSISNPEGLYDNFFFHHWAMHSISPFTPAIAFGTKDNTIIITPKEETNAAINEITLTSKSGERRTVLKPGSVMQAGITWTKGPANKGYAVDWYLKNTTSKATKISNEGVLVIGDDEKDGYYILGVNVNTKSDPAGTKPVNKEISIQVKRA